MAATGGDRGARTSEEVQPPGLHGAEARPAVAEVDVAGDEAGEACAITAWSGGTQKHMEAEWRMPARR